MVLGQTRALLDSAFSVMHDQRNLKNRNFTGSARCNRVHVEPGSMGDRQNHGGVGSARQQQSSSGTATNSRWLGSARNWCRNSGGSSGWHGLGEEIGEATAACLARRQHGAARTVWSRMRKTSSPVLLRVTARVVRLGEQALDRSSEVQQHRHVLKAREQQS